jgi:hypothetical protein
LKILSRAEPTPGCRDQRPCWQLVRVNKFHRELTGRENLNGDLEMKRADIEEGLMR